MRRVDAGYLKRTAESPAVRMLKSRALDTLNLTSGGSVVDIGCGPAIDTIELARRVGPSGLVLGVDADPVMVKEANRIAAENGVGAFTRHVLGEAAALEYETGSFDACFCERVLQHLKWDDAARASGEIVRVVRPGGRIAIIDTDWGTLSIAARDPQLERRVVHEHALSFHNPFAGRYLLSLFRPFGLADLRVETFSLQLGFDAVRFLLEPVLSRGVAAGQLSIFEARRWHYDIEAARDYGMFYAHVSMTLLTGAKR